MSGREESRTGHESVQRTAEVYGHIAENDAPVTVITLLHSFDQWTGMCRCGSGPFVTSEWVAHYKAQDQPTVTRVIPPASGD